MSARPLLNLTYIPQIVIAVSQLSFVRIAFFKEETVSIIVDPCGYVTCAEFSRGGKRAVGVHLNELVGVIVFVTNGIGGRTGFCQFIPSNVITVFYSSAVGLKRLGQEARLFIIDPACGCAVFGFFTTLPKRSKVSL